MRPSYEPSSQHTVARSVMLHLLPGVLGTVFYVLIVSITVQLGFPPLFALLLSGLLVLVPFELGHLLREVKKTSGRLPLTHVVGYRERLSLHQYFLIIPLLVLSGVILALILSPIDQFLRRAVFSWLPAWYFFDVGISGYSHYALVVTAITRLGVDGFVVPVLEEAYFRGHLLPSISNLKGRAPAMNALLFAFYHFWQPWNYPSILALALLLVYPVWKKRNVYLGIITHCSLNMIGAVLFLLVALR